MRLVIIFHTMELLVLFLDTWIDVLEHSIIAPPEKRRQHFPHYKCDPPTGKESTFWLFLTMLTCTSLIHISRWDQCNVAKQGRLHSGLTESWPSDYNVAAMAFAERVIKCDVSQQMACLLKIQHIRFKLRYLGPIKTVVI